MERWPAAKVAAHAVSEASGWDLIPPTVMRDGPFGQGMVQLWMEVDESVDVTAIVGDDLPALRRIALLDAVLTTPIARAGTCCTPRRADPGRGQRPLLRRRAEAAGRSCGAGVVSRSRRRGAVLSRLRDVWEATWRMSARAAGTDGDSGHDPPPRRPARAPTLSASPTATGPSSRGRRSSPSATAARGSLARRRTRWCSRRTEDARFGHNRARRAVPC